MEEASTERMIDVVEELAYPNQSEAYVESYRKWRRKPQNRYAFAFRKDSKEVAFSENKAILKDSPSAAEQKTLRQLGYLLGCALILYLVIENVMDKLIVFIMNSRGMDIEMLFLGSYLYGDEKYVFFVTTIVSILKYALPALMLQLVLRLPMRVSMPLKVRRPKELLLGICLTMLLSTGFGVAFISRSAELEKYRLISSVVDDGDQAIVFYMLLTIFAVPLITEFLLHGCMFQVLRQFGDQFAIGAISVIASLLGHNLQDAVRMGIMTLIFSIFVVRTGSFWAAAMLHIVHEIYMFALYYIETMSDLYSPLWWVTVLLPCFLSLSVGIYMLLRHYEPEVNKTKHHTHLSWYDKAAAFFSAMPMLCLVIVCIVLTVISGVML